MGPAVHGEILAKLAGIVDSGALKPLLDEQRFAFDEVGAAYARLEAGGSSGKVVIGL